MAEKTLEELRAELNLLTGGGFIPYGQDTEEASPQNTGILGDIVTSAQEGFYQIGADLTGALNISPAEDWLNEKVKEQQEEYSPEMIEAKANFGIGEDKQFFNRALISEIAKQGGQLPMFVVPGGAAAKGISAASKALGATKKARDAVVAAKKTGLKNKVFAAQQKLDKAEKQLKTAATAAGYGSVNGLIIGEGTADEVEEYLGQRTQEDWLNDDQFMENYNANQGKGLTDKELWDQSVKDTINGARAEAFLKAASLGAATGGVTGPLLSKAVTGAGKGGITAGAVRGVAAEAPSEFVEEAGQASIAGDIAGVETDVLERGVMGAALGGIVGGAAGGGAKGVRQILGQSDAELDGVLDPTKRPDIYTEAPTIDLLPSSMTPITETPTSPQERQRVLQERVETFPPSSEIATKEEYTSPAKRELMDAEVMSRAAARAQEIANKTFDRIIDNNTSDKVGEVNYMTGKVPAKDTVGSIGAPQPAQTGTTPREVPTNTGGSGYNFPGTKMTSPKEKKAKIAEEEKQTKAAEKVKETRKKETEDKRAARAEAKAARIAQRKEKRVETQIAKDAEREAAFPAVPKQKVPVKKESKAKPKAPVKEAPVVETKVPDNILTEDDVKIQGGGKALWTYQGTANGRAVVSRVDKKGETITKKVDPAKMTKIEEAPLQPKGAKVDEGVKTATDLFNQMGRKKTKVVEEKVEEAPEVPTKAEPITETVEETPTVEEVAETNVEEDAEYVDGVKVQKIPEGVTSKTGKKRKKGTKTVVKKGPKYDSKGLGQKVENGDITLESAKKVASPEGVAAGLITQAEADLWNADNTALSVEEGTRTSTQVDGFVKVYGRGSPEHRWAVANLDNIPDFDAMAEKDGFRATVSKLMRGEPTQIETAANESREFQLKGIIDELNEAEEAGDTDLALELIKARDMLLNEMREGQPMEGKSDVEPELPKWAQPTEPTRDTMNSVQNITDIITERFGGVPRNVFILENFNKLPASVGRVEVQGANAFYSPLTKSIYLNASYIRKGKELNTIYHELTHAVIQKNRKSWEALVQNVHNLAAKGDPIARQAMYQARRVVSEDRLARDPDARNKEELAYMMTFAPSSSLTKRVVRKLKEMFKKTFGIELTSEELIDTLKAKIDYKVAQDVKAAKDIQSTYDQQMEAIRQMGEEGQVETIEFEEQTDADYLNESVITSEDPKFSESLYENPKSTWVRHFDTTVNRAKNMGSKLYESIRNKGLGFIPMRPLVDMLERALPEGSNIKKILDSYDRAEAASNERIESLNDGVNKDFFMLQKDKPEQYRKVVKLMLSATYNNKDVEGTRGFEELDQDAQQVYRDVRDHYANMARDKVDALRTNLQAMEINTEQRKGMEQIVETLEGYLRDEKVYFPFNRFGEWSVRGTTPDGREYVSHHDTRHEAGLERDRLERQGFKELQFTKTVKAQESVREMMSAEAYNMATNYIKTSTKGMSGDAAEAAQDALWKTFMHYSPHAAAHKRLLVRRNVMGMSEDMVRGLNQSINRDVRANELLRVKPEIDNILSETKKIIDEQPDNTEMIELFEEMKKRSEGKDIRSGWSKNLTKANFVYYMGFNPSTALVNFTQNYILGAPVLSDEFGLTRSAAELSKEMVWAGRHIKDKETMGYEGRELSAYKSLKRDRVIDTTNAHLMTELNEGHSADANPFGFKSLFVKGSAIMFHNAEIINRVSMSMVAYKMHYEKYGNHNEALAYAKEKTYEAHFAFGESDKARYQQGDLGNVLLALKTHPINMAVNMARNFNRVLFDSKATPEEKYTARKQLMGTFIMTSILGGSLALPLTGLVPELFMTLFGDDDREPEQVIRESLESVSNKVIADIVLNGIVGTAAGIDMQSRVSIGLDMFIRADGGQTLTELKEKVVEGALGPVYGIGSKAIYGIDLMADGKWAHGFNAMLPSAFRNLNKAAFDYERGIATTAYDTKIEDFSGKDALLRAVGFGSDEYSQYYTIKSDERRQEEGINSKKSYLLREYSLAMLTGDPEEKREARRAIREYNRSAPSKEARISQSTLKRSLTTYRKKLSGES